jgi:hypothetical protein
MYRAEVTQAIANQAIRAIEDAIYNLTSDEDLDGIEIEIQDDGTASCGLDWDCCFDFLGGTDQDLTAFGEIPIDEISSRLDGIVSALICMEGEGLARESWEKFTEWLQDEDLESCSLCGSNPLGFMPHESEEDLDGVDGIYYVYFLEGTKREVWEYHFDGFGKIWLTA